MRSGVMRLDNFDAAHLDKNGSLLTVEGEYTSYNNELFPLND